MSKLPVNIKGNVFEIEDRNLVEGIKSLHSSIEKLKSERAELRKRDIRSSELVERVHRHCEARGVIRKVGQCPVEALLTNHSDHVGMVEQLNAEKLEIAQRCNTAERLVEKLKAERVELRKVSEAHKHNTALVIGVSEYCRENSIGDWGGSAVEALLTSHSDHVGKVEQLVEAVGMLEANNLSDHGAHNKEEHHMCEMLLRKMRGQPVECSSDGKYWFISAINKLEFAEFKYRIPVKKLNIPWEHIKPEYKFAAVDSQGDLNVYTVKPNLDTIDSEWDLVGSSDGEYRSIDGLNIDIDGIDWRESLTKRPE